MGRRRARTPQHVSLRGGALGRSSSGGGGGGGGGGGTRLYPWCGASRIAELQLQTFGAMFVYAVPRSKRRAADDINCLGSTSSRLWRLNAGVEGVPEWRVSRFAQHTRPRTTLLWSHSCERQSQRLKPVTKLSLEGAKATCNLQINEAKTRQKKQHLGAFAGRLSSSLAVIIRLWKVLRRTVGLERCCAALRLSGVSLSMACAAAPQGALIGAVVAAARTVPILGPAFEAFALVFFSEFGDKSMFSTALLSMRYGTRSMQMVVLLGSMAALTTMTFISCFLGRLMSFLPARITLILSVLLLAIFGVRFLQQAIVAWRRDRIRSATAKPGEDEGDEEAAAARDLERYRISVDDTAPAVFAKSFTIIALSEWCDRSMFATMALAASTNAYAVIIGASLANFVCTGMAVAGGSLFHKLPERIVNLAAGVLFLATAAYTWLFELPEADS
jgi:putative Ca2+/H+ antiporter (TMEM165/GDT1 family)